MFDVENVIKHVELSDPKSICIVGEQKSGKHEILELSLPDKITVAPSQEGLVKNSDLKMRSGCYATAPVMQVNKQHLFIFTNQHYGKLPMKSLKGKGHLF